MYEGGAVDIRSVKPKNETRGIRGYDQVLETLRAIPGVKASPVLYGEGLLNVAGTDVAIVLNGMIPDEVQDVSTIGDYMISGSIDDLIADPDGIIIGSELARKASLGMNKNLKLSTTGGQTHTFKIVGLFRTGRAHYDEGEVFVNLKRVQALLDRANRVNSILVKLDDPYQARNVAGRIENAIGYKSLSWQEASEDLMSTLTIRNIIMYTVVGAVLVVAAFGIYNVISTVVLEKRRDIAILKSIGFRAGDIQWVFVLEGLLLGIGGSVVGVALGAVFMFGLGQIEFKFPGSADPTRMPIDWSWVQFAIAAAFAMGAALFAAYLPARRGAGFDPAAILRGS